MAVIDGHVLPLNPGEPPHMQMFIWNNLFFSLGFDISDHYHPIGGNTAAHAAALCDLRGAQVEIIVGIPARVLRCFGIHLLSFVSFKVIYLLKYLAQRVQHNIYELCQSSFISLLKKSLLIPSSSVEFKYFTFTFMCL